ncbi:hypothetical protein [Limnoraphis robusta]|uniref:hypothetical protein n=1 Tax=Limnoraphis robusta TaxID=1118279 RepID=UPI002B2120C2|nr:hypothetical protein [Limnoraphis robusta]MEA5499267.1 hypothetical protein [Limnoraphis robusta BA-68 BA1]
MNQHNDSIVIATSIAPVGIEKQRAAIQSWLDLGFLVVSVNIQEEIDQLQPYFDDISFHMVKRDAREKYGKPFVYVNDILLYLEEHGSKIVGIVNSDIHLKAGKDFISYVRQETTNSVLFASRLDIDTVESEAGEMYGYGFDMFFFDRKLLKYFPLCDDFCLGIPWWDYWIPCIAIQNDLNPKYLQNTVAYHVKHKINYSIETWRKVGLTFTSFYRSELTPSLQQLLLENKLNLLDDKLGLSATYDFILEVYQKSKLLNYKNYSNQNKIEDSEKETKYNNLVFLAWQNYNRDQMSEMCKYLNQSFKYSSCSLPTQVIADWIERFKKFSEKENFIFDSYSLSCNPTWQHLVVSILIP